MVKEYKSAPRVTRERLYLESMQEVLSNVSKVMVENKSGSNLLYLPLDKLIRERSAGDGRSSVINGVNQQTNQGTINSSGQNIGSTMRNIVGEGRTGALNNLRDRVR